MIFAPRSSTMSALSQASIPQRTCNRASGRAFSRGSIVTRHVGRPVLSRFQASVAASDAAVMAAVAVAPAPVHLAPGKVHQLEAVDLESVHASCSSLVVVDVYTNWCGPCKMIAPELEKMAQEFGDKVVMCKIDCTSNNDNKKWAIQQNVKALPTFILFKNGTRINDMTGAKAETLRKLIAAHM